MASLKDTLAQLPIATVEVIRPATSPLPTLAGLGLEQAAITPTGTSDGTQYSCDNCTYACGACTESCIPQH